MNIAARVPFWAGQMPSAKQYVQRGLIAHWDGIENEDYGKHSQNPNRWKDLVGDRVFQTSEGTPVLQDNLSYYFNGSAKMVLSKFESFAGCSYEIVFRWNTTWNAQHIMFDCDANNAPCIGCLSNSQFCTFHSSALTIASNTKNNYIYAHLGSRQIAVDGVLKAVGSADNWGVRGVNAVSIGKRANSTDAWTGAIYAIRVYNRALTPEEIAANYALDCQRFGLS